MARKRRWPLVVITVVLLVLGASAVLLLRAKPWQPPAQAAAPAGHTAALVRTDLVQRERFDGTLGYDGAYVVPARSAPGAVLTALPVAGQVIHRGAALYAVNGRPVPMLVGTVPFWRRLATGVDDGPDVGELKDNLRALGFGPALSHNDHFSQATADALARWQRALGVPDTGALDPADAVVEPGDVRVTAVNATLGAAPAGTLLTLSSTTRVVTANVPVAQQSLAKPGASVQIGLPGGTATAGTIDSVGTLATSPPSQPNQPPRDDAANATLPVRITLAKPADAGTLDGAPVTVDVVSDQHTGVLAAPVNALLANPDGSYAVDVVDGTGATHRVVVRLGFFANGLVEVSGPGLAEGTRVEVPAPS